MSGCVCCELALIRIVSIYKQLRKRSRKSMIVIQCRYRMAALNISLTLSIDQIVRISFVRISNDSFRSLSFSVESLRYSLLFGWQNSIKFARSQINHAYDMRQMLLLMKMMVIIAGWSMMQQALKYLLLIFLVRLNVHVAQQSRAKYRLVVVMCFGRTGGIGWWSAFHIRMRLTAKNIY